MDRQLKKLMNELGAAINESLTESEPIAQVISRIKDSGYDGWLTIEAFGRALPELAAATCIWRDLFDSEEEVAREGLRFMKNGWQTASG